MAGARPLRVLIIEDVEDDALIVLRELRRGGFAPTSRRVDDAAGLAAALAERWDLALCDFGLPGFSAHDALAQVRAADPDLPFIIVSGTIGEESAVEAMRAGAADFVLKDRLGRLVPAIDRELREAANRAELRRAEDALRRAETLRAVGQMAVGIAHDLKNVLNPLGLHVSILERALARAGVERHDSLEAMREIIQQGVHTIDRLRSFSRLEPEPTHEEVDLATLAREAVAMMSPRVPGGVTLEVEAAVGCVVRARRGEVTGALVNLIVNALDACGGRGRITIEVGCDDAAAWIAVADDGPGIPPEHQARIFEPFFTTKGDEGTGLGLPNVFATMRRHGGDVEVDTAPGRGARFTLRFSR